MMAAKMNKLPPINNELRICSLRRLAAAFSFRDTFIGFSLSSILMILNLNL